MVVYRFFTGDENGIVKSVKFNVPPGRITPERPIVTTVTTIDERPNAGRVQLMAAGQASDGSRLLAVSRGNGSTSIHSYVHKGEDIIPQQEWSETRFKPLEDVFVGLCLSPQGTYTCTSRGHLRLTPHQTNNQDVGAPSPTTVPLTAYLPTRLKAFQMSPVDQRQFAYGGDEVELSLWDVEKTFTKEVSGKEGEGENHAKVLKKGRKKEVLFPGETWRSRNVPHDFLNIRDQVHITALSFLSPATTPDDGGSSSSRTTNLITGSLSGAVRSYDTRTEDRRPTQSWDKVIQPGHGGVKTIEQGHSENQVFVSDASSNLYSLDVRNGRIIYKYPSISGAVVSVSCTPPSVSSLVPTLTASAAETTAPTSPSIAPSNARPLPTRPPHLASVSLDRFIRLHTAPIPPINPTQNSNGLVTSKYGIEGRGKVLAKEFLKGTPTCVVWDMLSGVLDLEDELGKRRRKEEREKEEEEAIWMGMEMAGVGKSGAKGKRKPADSEEDSGDEDEDSEDESTAVRKVKRGRMG
ncbi:hypothetical protein FRB95_001294 [Tulasnella sp. JGI-2019a]|nr:hypothetical protein FRB95_001294 [Tulasnella sp. JGI-2019a]